jgi:hypothetical protein
LFGCFSGFINFAWIKASDNAVLSGVRPPSPPIPFVAAARTMNRAIGGVSQSVASIPERPAQLRNLIADFEDALIKCRRLGQ